MGERELHMRVAIVLAVLSLAACATYQSKVEEARESMRAGNPAKAAALLEPMASKQNDDQLVYLLDYGTALQQSGDFKKSNDNRVA